MEQASHKVFVYVGQDQVFFKAIQAETLRTQCSDKKNVGQYHFVKIDSGGNVFDIYQKIISYPVDILYLDFSQDKIEMEILGNIVGKSHKLKSAVKVGLVDQLKLSDNVYLCEELGLSFFHAKGVEIFDVVFNPFSLKFPNEVVLPQFAQAMLKDHIQLYDRLLLHFAHNTTFRLLSTAPLPLDQEVTLHHFFPQEFLSSNQFYVKKLAVSTHAKKIGFDLTPAFLPPLAEKQAVQFLKKMRSFYSGSTLKSKLSIVSEEEEFEPSSLLQLSDEDEPFISFGDEDNILPKIETKSVVETECLDLAKEHWWQYLKNQKTYPCPTKELRLLVIQRGNDLLKSNKFHSLYHTYSLSIYDYIEKVDEVLHREKPQLIAFEFEPLPSKIPEHSTEMDYNNTEKLKEVFMASRSLPDYFPHILVFNNPTYTSARLQDAFEYNQVLSHPGKMSSEMLFDFAALLQQRKVKKFENGARKKWDASDSDLKPQTVWEDYLPSYLIPANHQPIRTFKRIITVQLMSISEIEINFVCDDEEFLIGETYRMDAPLSLSLTIVPKRAISLGANKQNVFRGLIHSISEMDKQKIRRFVNSVFTKIEESRRDLSSSEMDDLKRKYLSAKSE